MRALRIPFRVTAVLLCGALSAAAVDLGDGHVRLRVESYDFWSGPEPRAAPATRTAPEATDTWVVVVEGPAGRAVREGIESFGGRVVGYVPSLAYLVRAEAASIAALRESPFVDRVDRYRPAWKISPDIGARTFRDPARLGLGRTLVLDVRYFAGEDPARVRQRVSAAGARVIAVHHDHGARRVVATADPGLLLALAALPEVEWIEETAEPALRNDNVRWVMQSDVTLHAPLHDRGLLGEGEIVGHIDGEIQILSCYFRDPVDNTPGPGHRKVVALRSSGATAGQDHGTHTAGTVAGDREPIDQLLIRRGMAPKARLSFSNLNDLTGLGNMASNLLQFLQAAHADGARIHTNSWGEPPGGLTGYTTLSVDVDTFTRSNEEDLVLFAVANTGDSPNGKVMAPENAKNCLAVAATQAPPQQHMHGTGEPGPTFDGRRKPEVLVPGINTSSAAPTSCATGSISGTSMACPAVAGGAALVREYLIRGFYPTGHAWPQHSLTPTGALLKAIVVNSAVDMTGEVGYPSDLEGWGRVLLDDALYFPGDSRRLRLRDVRHASGLDTGETDALTIKVTDPSEPLAITLAFTDQPASQGAALAPVNDLDLEVQDPGGLVYLGNVFDVVSGQSIVGGTPDPLNNLERVRIAAPPTGTWRIRVLGSSVPMGPQGYAVVVNGGLFPAVPDDGPSPPDRPPDTVVADRSPPRALKLDPMHPSPFRGETVLRLEIPDAVFIRVGVFDVTGRRVRSLVDRTVSPGEYRLRWDGRDDSGQPVAAGVYFARLETSGGTRTVRGVLLR